MHKSLGFDRDGELHECPEDDKAAQNNRDTFIKRPTPYQIRHQLLALIGIAHSEGLTDAADFIREVMSERGIK